MANTYILKLSDGTVTTDLLADSQRVRYAGLNMPMPEVKADYIDSHFTDGARLAHSHFGNRTIDITTRFYASTQTQLKTNVRTVERLLNDAEKHNLLGYGSNVYLEYNWGTTTTESVYYDIIRGNLSMPTDYLSNALNQNYILNAKLTLTCKPFGRYSNQTMSTVSTTNAIGLNYVDVTTSELYGDVPARLYMLVSTTGFAAATTQTMWVAKRSGSRQTNTLGVEGEALTGYTTVYGGTFTTSTSAVVDASCSGGNYERTRFTEDGGAGENIPTDTKMGYFYFQFGTPPEGMYRVIIRGKVIDASAGGTLDWDHMDWGYGYSYGNKTFTPSQTLGQYYSNNASNAYDVLDLGLLNIPPIARSDIVPDAPFNLRIYTHVKLIGSLTAGETVDWDLDYVFLMPLDEGCVIIGSVNTTDRLALDGITDPEAVYNVNSTGNFVADYPSYDGGVFKLGRESTRIYFLNDDTATTKCGVTITYQPQFLVI